MLESKTFGYWTVIQFKGKYGHRINLWLCKCRCGNKKIVMQHSLTSGKSRSCGCFMKQKATTHGLSKSRLYIRWCHIIDRCLNKNSLSYRRYGARGIRVSKEWLKFENFRDDMKESFDIHVKKYGEKNSTIERIDNNGSYSKENCKWATWKEQTHNRESNILINYKGKIQNLKKWAYELEFDYKKVWSRIYKLKWSVERAFETK